MATYKVKPTPKQVKALSLISQGMKAGQAMIEAGYSKVSAKNPKLNLLSKTGFLTAQQKLLMEYDKQGLSPEYLAKKTKQLLEATKDSNEDYSIQLQTLKLVLDQTTDKPNNNNGKTREVVLTEYINS